MKMPPVELHVLKQAIEPLDTLERRAAYWNESPARYRWDLFWAATGEAFRRHLWDDLDLHDSHIDTALRKIVKDHR
jgi:hypothetical protein